MTYQLLVFGCLSLLLLPSQTLAQAFCAPLASSSSLAGFCLFANAVINENDTGRTNTSSRINITEDLIEFRIQSFSKDVGYAAVGLGSSMSSAEVFVS